MKRTGLTLLILLPAVLGFAPGEAAEPDAAPVTIAVPGGDSLAIRVPAGWTQSVGKMQGDGPPTVDVSSPGGLKMNLTMMADVDGQFATAEAVDAFVLAANQHLLDNAIEKTPTLIRITSKVGRGAYSTFTDGRLTGVTTPEAGAFRCVTSGLFVIGKHATIFMILSNDTANDEYRRALDVISNGITLAPAGH